MNGGGTMKEKFYCPVCNWELPTERDIVTESMHILNQCFNCKAKLWNDKGDFLGKIEEGDEA